MGPPVAYSRYAPSSLIARVKGSGRLGLALPRGLLPRRLMVALTAGASGRPLITCTLPGEYRAAAVPEGLKTTRRGAPSESTASSSGASAVRRNRCAQPSLAA